MPRSPSRTNLFSVNRDKVTDFLKWVKKYDLHLVGNPANERVYLTPPEDSETGSFPDLDPETEENFDFADELSQFIAPGSIAVVIDVGRYVTGFAVAIDHQGNREEVSLLTIYDLAIKRWPKSEITSAE